MAEQCGITGGAGGGKGLEMALGTNIKGSLQGRVPKPKLIYSYFYYVYIKYTFYFFFHSSYFKIPYFATLCHNLGHECIGSKGHFFCPFKINKIEASLSIQTDFFNIL